MPTFFKKELVSNALYLPTGEKIKFEELAGNLGVISTDEPRFITELNKSAQAHKHGVVAITETDYAELKKKGPPKLTSQPSSLNAQNISSLLSKLAGQKVPAAGVAKPAQAIASRTIEGSQKLTVPDKLPVVMKRKKPNSPDPHPIPQELIQTTT